MTIRIYKRSCQLWRGSPGFTVVEFLMAAFVFSIIVIVVGLAFVQVLDLQRRGINAQKVQENALFVLESMAKEIRVSNVLIGQDANCTSTFRDTLTIVHPVNATVSYSLFNNVVQRTVAGDTLSMSSNEVKFSRLSFCVQGSDLDDNQARIAIVTRVENVTNRPRDNVIFDLQTTVTSRDIALELQN